MRPLARVLEVVAPILLIGVGLGLVQGAVSAYLRRLLLPDGMALLGLLGAAVCGGVLWMLLAAPVIAALGRAWPAAERPARRFRLGGALAVGTAAWPVLRGLVTPLVDDLVVGPGAGTAALVGNPWLSPYLGLNQGFDRYENPSVRAEAFASLADIPVYRLALGLLPRRERGDDRARAITDRALGWLAEPADRPLFLWVHYIDPHSPFESSPDRVADNSMVHELGGGLTVYEDGRLVGERFAAVHEVRTGNLILGPGDRGRLAALYVAEVRYTDTHVGRLIDALQARAAPPVLALAADHGEELWDHGGFGHSHDYYAEVTRVPLVFAGPGVPAGRRVSGPVGLIDVGPTLLDLAGVGGGPEGPETETGRSLVSTWTDGDASFPLRFSENNLYRLPAALAADGPWRLILRANGVAELYDAEADPRERRERSADAPEVAARMRAALEARWSEAPPDAAGEALSAESIEALRALGYVQ